MSRRHTPGVGVLGLAPDGVKRTPDRDLRYLADMVLITGAFIGWYSPNYGGNDCAGGAVIWGLV